MPGAGIVLPNYVKIESQLGTEDWTGVRGRLISTYGIRLP